jgi:hypothetical protein
MDMSAGVGDGVKWERTKDQITQQPEDGLLHPPKARKVSLIKQVLRGKIPGLPG